MDAAWAMADEGAPHGVVVVARTQTAGRGRFSRAWTSGDGESLLLSALLRPPAPAAALLSPMGALAAADAAGEASGVRCELKWPNDVLVGGRKVCGVLVEVRADTNGVVTAVLGVGLNVNLDFGELPPPPEGEGWGEARSLRVTATSLAEQAGRRLDVREVESIFLARLRERYRQCVKDGPSLLAEWASRLSTLGLRVTVREREGAFTGVAERVDDAGRLIVRLDSGALRAVSEGDVTLAGQGGDSVQ